MSVITDVCGVGETASVNGGVTIDAASGPRYGVGVGSCIDAAVSSGVCGAEIIVILKRARVPIVAGFEHARRSLFLLAMQG
jgi:hypothetical protein